MFFAGGSQPLLPCTHVAPSSGTNNIAACLAGASSCVPPIQPRTWLQAGQGFVLPKPTALTAALSPAQLLLPPLPVSGSSSSAPLARLGAPRPHVAYGALSSAAGFAGHHSGELAALAAGAARTAASTARRGALTRS